MIAIRCKLAGKEPIPPIDEVSIRDLFIGDVEFRIGSWVMKMVLEDLRVEGIESTFDCTDSDGVIYFSRNGANVKVTTNYARGASAVSYAELQAAVVESASQLKRQLTKIYPDLLENKTFFDFFPD